MPTQHQDWDTPATGDSGTVYASKIETILSQLDSELILRGTRAERLAYDAPEVDLIWLETDNFDTAPLWYYDGVQWNELSIGSGASTDSTNNWTADQRYIDDINLILGTDSDFGLSYDSTENELQVVTNPGGTATELFSIDSAGNLATTGTITTTGGVTTTTGSVTTDSGNITTSTGNVNGENLQVNGNTIARSRPISGQVTLAGGTATVDTNISAVDATFMLALGVDDPAADCKVAGSLFWDDSDGSYWIEINETTTSVGNPTVNYDVIRVR